MSVSARKSRSWDNQCRREQPRCVVAAKHSSRYWNGAGGRRRNAAGSVNGRHCRELNGLISGKTRKSRNCERHEDAGDCQSQVNKTNRQLPLVWPAFATLCTRGPGFHSGCHASFRRTTLGFAIQTSLIFLPAEKNPKTQTVRHRLAKCNTSKTPQLCGSYGFTLNPLEMPGSLMGLY